MKKLKIAMVGLGNIANCHLAAYQSLENVEIVAGCDINPETLEKTCNKYNIARRYLDEDQMLAENPDIEAIDVCVWNCNHASCSIKGLNAGRHVICEKPMAYSAEEAQQMLEAAEKNNRLLMIGFVLRFSNDAIVARDFINKGILGDVYYAKMNYVRRHGNPGGWFADKKRSGGGPVIDLGVHMIDLSRYLMGNPKPVSVYASTYDNIGCRPNVMTGPEWSVGENTVSDVEDIGIAMIRFDNGATMLLETSYEIQGEDLYKRQIFGTKGGLDLTSGVKYYSESNNFLSSADLTVDGMRDANGNGFGDMFRTELAHFVDCVLNGTECRAKAEDGVEIMKILDAIYKSAETGHEVIL